MTFAPASIKQVRAFLKGEDPDLSDVELGIVGGPSHIRTGTSYHLGRDQLIMSKNPYSARTGRDRAGLSNAASALDIDDDLDELRQLSVWLVEQCRANAPDTRDVREIIYSPDGVRVLRWDRERGVSSAPISDSDLSHRTHTHISWYRDSEHRDKTAVFRRFFEEGNDVELIKQIQTALKAAGHDPGEIDGIWGPRTHAAFVAALRSGVGPPGPAGPPGPQGPQGPPGGPGKTPVKVAIAGDVVAWE